MPKKKSTVEEVYEVECITAARVTDDHQWEYNIKWGGYSEDENSWEPEANLNGCARMMTEFWQQVGSINKGLSKKFPADHELTPSELWMVRQRDTYQKTQAKKKAQKNKLRHAKPKETGRGRVPPPPPAPFWAPESTDQSSREPPNYDSDDDDTPLSEKIKVTAKAPAPRSNTDDHPASSSKRKRDDKSSPEPSDKRLKGIVAEETSITSFQDDFAASSHVDDAQEAVAIPSRDDGPQEVLAASSKDDAAQEAIASSSTDNNGRPPASPRNSLFGDGSDSEDIPLASKASRPPPAVSQITKEQTQSTTQPSMSPETQIKEKSKIPLHRQRKQNPRVKPMDIPLLDTNLGGISTKTRILSQSTAKSAAPSLPRITVRDNASGPSSGIGASPMLMDIPGLATPDLDANNWLKENIMSKEELARAGPNTSRPSSAEPSSNIAAQRFSKRWRWTGQLAVGDNETGFAEPVGSIVITDNTLPNRDIGQPKLESLLPTRVDTICFRHQYTLSALQTVLGDFTLSQFAVMTADKSNDETSFDDVVSYMSKYEMFSQCALTISEREAATLFVFPSTCLPLLDYLGVPVKVRQDKGLIVATGFKAYIPPKRTKGGFVVTYTDDWKADSKVDLGQETRSADCSRARLALNFPESLFLRLNNKQCSIFTTPSDKDLPGHESRSLITVLENAPACKIVLPTGNARFIFIHVSSWDMLHKLPGLVDRRLRRPDVQFYTYGSDPSIERKRWGVHEVFPLGGVVTFTPRAIMENPAGVEQLIAKLDEHPLWTCYIIPSVIPELCEIAAEQDSGDSAAKGGIEALCSILFPIEKGQIALTWQPPQRVEHDANLGAKWVDWMMDQGRLSDLRGGDLVLECQKRFERQKDRSEKKDVEAQIVRDLLAMQSELREEYRRFVIITDSTGPSNTSKEAAASTSSSKADIKDGFELTHVKDFVFNDDYVFSDNIKSF